MVCLFCHCLFLVLSSFGALGRLCFVIVLFPGCYYLYFIRKHLTTTASFMSVFPLVTNKVWNSKMPLPYFLPFFKSHLVHLANCFWIYIQNVTFCERMRSFESLTYEPYHSISCITKTRLFKYIASIPGNRETVPYSFFSVCFLTMTQRYNTFIFHLKWRVWSQDHLYNNS